MLRAGDLVALLLAVRLVRCADVVVATSRVHTVCALWPVSLAPDVRAALVRGERGVWRLIQVYRVAEVAFRSWGSTRSST